MGDSIFALFAELRTKTIEDCWDSAQLDCEAERQRMEKAHGEWENRVKVLEAGFFVASETFEAGLALSLLS